MRTVIGIIAEFNPFHKGHLYLIEKLRSKFQTPYIMVAMSGSIMQRGEPAFADKWLRAETALRSGADLVFELPTVFSCRSAEFFARGGVELLSATNAATHLAFGAETDNGEKLISAAATLLNSQKALSELIKSGKSYATATQELLQTDVATDIATTSNNILALEYCKALQQTNSVLQPIIIKRQGADYNDRNINASTASASAIRAEYKVHLQITPSIKEQIPIEALNILQNNLPLGYNEQTLDTLICYKLRTSSAEAILGSCECSEGLENSLKNAATETTFDDIVHKITNKRYPSARIRRLLMQLLLNQERRIFDEAKPQYLRILGFNERGRELLAVMRDNTSIPIITKIGKNYGGNYDNKALVEQMNIDITAHNLLRILQNRPHLCDEDFLRSPIYVKD